MKMAENQDENQDNNQDENPVQSESTSSSQTENSEHMIPKSRFDEVNNKYRTLAQELEELRANQQKARETELIEQNRYKELYEEAQRNLQGLQGVQSEAEKYKQQVQATNKARIEQIPEEKRSLIPDFDDPIKLGAYLDLNFSQLVAQPKPKAPNLDGGSGSGGGSDIGLTAAQQAVVDIARQSGFQVKEDNISRFKRDTRQPKPK
jgi:ribonucleoside-triphosphate reductase